MSTREIDGGFRFEVTKEDGCVVTKLIPNDDDELNWISFPLTPEKAIAYAIALTVIATEEKEGPQ